MIEFIFLAAVIALLTHLIADVVKLQKTSDYLIQTLPKKDATPTLEYKMESGIEEMYNKNGEFIFPHVGSIQSSGFDVMAAESVLLKPGQRRAIGTGLSFKIPEGYEIQVRPRSGLALKHGITVLNTPGTIDEDYRGEVKIILYNSDQNDYTVKRGDRIAQLVLAKRTPITIFEKVDEVNVAETTRQDNGFGSSGF
jgi:dUTP pyrophosphatase